jgi:hypothetical protein
VLGAGCRVPGTARDKTPVCYDTKREAYNILIFLCDEVRKMLISMINNPEQWCLNKE